MGGEGGCIRGEEWRPFNKEGKDRGEGQAGASGARRGGPECGRREGMGGRVWGAECGGQRMVGIRRPFKAMSERGKRQGGVDYR